jgi:hypothetical protein
MLEQTPGIMSLAFGSKTHENHENPENWASNTMVAVHAINVQA